MPSFIFQVATVAMLALANMQGQGASAAPIHSSERVIAGTLAHQGSHDPQSLTSTVVKHLHALPPVVRTLSSEDYYHNVIQNNQHYQAVVEQIEFSLEDSLETISSETARATATQIAETALVGACTAKVLEDLEDINAYHRGIMQDAETAYEEALSSSMPHTINFMEVREARTHARSLRLYSDLEILEAAEDHCHFSQNSWLWKTETT